MSEHCFELTQQIRYRAYVEADTREEALAKLEKVVDEGDGEDLDIVEVDCSHFEIHS